MNTGVLKTLIKQLPMTAGARMCFPCFFHGFCCGTGNSEFEPDLGAAKAAGTGKLRRQKYLQSIEDNQ